MPQRRPTRECQEEKKVKNREKKRCIGYGVRRGDRDIMFCCSQSRS